MLDLRVPSGLFFLLVGAILTGLGLINPGLRAKLTDINVNLYVGMFMLTFGGALLLLAARSKSRG